MLKLRELVKQIETELFDLPYAVSIYGDVARIVLYERSYEKPHLCQVVEKKRYEVHNLEEWNAIREKLVPTHDLLGAYKIYINDPDDAIFKALAERIAMKLYYRGIKVGKYS